MSNAVAVIGLGYVGLPLACLCAHKGYQTVGFDLNENAISKLSNGECHIRDEVVEKLLDQAIKSENFLPTLEPSRLNSCDIFLICVPTPVNAAHEPDIEPLLGAIKSIAPFVKKGALVVVESTVFPGTCEDFVKPMLEELTGLFCDEDFDLAHCPERVNPGDVFWTSANIPRVVGATRQEGALRAADFYSSILGGSVIDVRDVRNSLRPKFSVGDGNTLNTKNVPLGSVTVMRSIRDAEAVKAMENTVRDVNIAFVNELAKISDVLDLDVVDIIDGMSTKPFGKGPFYPGAGVGGHCIAVDPEWLKSASIKAGFVPQLIQMSRDTNNHMPEYAVQVLQDLLNELSLPLRGAKVAVLGVSYKANVDDPRESPFYAVRESLIKKGAIINVFDTWVSQENTHQSLSLALEDCVAVIIVTDHADMMEDLAKYDFEHGCIKVVVDGRNALDAEMLPKSLLYRGIGRR